VIGNVMEISWKFHGDQSDKWWQMYSKCIYKR
jgi:hypothetical protein